MSIENTPKRSLIHLSIVYLGTLAKWDVKVYVGKYGRAAIGFQLLGVGFNFLFLVRLFTVKEKMREVVLWLSNGEITFITIYTSSFFLKCF